MLTAVTDTDSCDALVLLICVIVSMEKDWVAYVMLWMVDS